MFILWVLTVLLIECTNGARDFSYRSSLMEGHKPILRLGPDESIELSESNSEVPKLDAPGEPKWSQSLRAQIQNLVQEYGFDDAKPHIKKIVEDTENKYNVLLDVKGKIRINYKYNMMRNDKILRSEKEDPTWVRELKTYVKAYIVKYGKTNMDELISPFIKIIEKKHHVIIKDIDVNKFGEIFVDYVNVKRRKTTTIPPPKNEVVRQGSDSQESDSVEIRFTRGIEV